MRVPGAIPAFFAAVFIALTAAAAAAGQADPADLLKQLESRDPGLRARAAAALGEAKVREAVAALTQRLALDPDVLVRRHCARALGVIGDRKALPALLFAITHQEDPGVVAEAVEGARALDRKAASQHIVGALTGPKSTHAERLNAVQALTLIPEPTSVNALLQASVDDDFMMVRKEAVGGVRNAPDRQKVLAFYLSALQSSQRKKKKAAAYALGELGDRDAVPALLAAGLAPNARIEFDALMALAKLPDPKSVPAVTAAWQRAVKDPEIRVAAVHALGEIRDARALPVLNWAMNEKDWFVRSLGARGLGALASDGAVFDGLLKGLAGADAEARYDYCLALGLAGDGRAALPLALAAKSGNLKVAVAAVDALSRLEGDPARKGLMELLKDARPEVRGLAARRLGILRHAEALDAVIELLADEDFPVQMDAAQALGRLQDAKAVPFLVALGKTTKSEALRAVVAQALGDINSKLGDTPAFKDSLAYLASLLGDKDVLVRAAAAWALEGAVCRESVDAVLAAWETEENRYVSHTYYQALLNLTGKDVLEDPAAWRAWWKEARQGFGRKSNAGEVSVPAFQVYLKELRSKGLDLVFVLDVTGSMGAELKEAQQRTGDIVRILRLVIPSLRVGFVAYRDEVAPDEKCPLTFDYGKAQDRLSRLEATGGGDINEAVCLGFESALKEMAWRKEARKVVVLVGDAPPHEPDKAKLIAFLANRELGVEFSAIEARTTDVVHLPSFVDVAVHGGGQVVRLEETKQLMRHFIISALGPAWRAEAARVIAALME